MVIGRGLLASAFVSDYKNESETIIFASGVSNSKETKATEFEREEKLLLKYINSDKKLVYFSTTSLDNIHLKNNMYVKHKLRMESLIKKKCSKYLIFRTSNIIGSRGNKATIVNYLYNNITDQKEFEIWQNAKRNILDIDDFAKICKIIMKTDLENEIVNICNFKNIGILEMVNCIEKKVKRKGVYTLVNKGGEVEIENSFLKKILSDKFIDKLTHPNYFESLLNKYYA